MMTTAEVELDVEKTFQEQAVIGEKLEKLLINFGKDSDARKTEDYIVKRLELTDTYWFTFKTNHEKLSAIKEAHQANLYFQNKYQERVQQVYYNLRTKLLEFSAKSQTPAPTTPVALNPARSSNSTSAGEENKVNKSRVTHDEETSDDMSGEVQRLVRKQKALMRTITHLIQDIEAKANEDHATPYFQLKIELLLKYQNDMVNLDQSIWECSSEETILTYQADLFHELDGWIQDTIISLQQRLLLQNSNNTTNQPASSPPQGSLVKLPKITLPTFDGNYMRWTSFHDLYIQLIHNQPISNAQKMFYLMSNLSGEARTLIQHLPVSDENYEDAWTTLKNRYDNKRLLVTAWLNKLLAQPTSQVESSAAIKALHDTTSECLLGLRNLGISTESWDPILVHLIVKKLDKTTHTLYEQSLDAPRELNSIKNVLQFMETRFQSLETLGVSAKGALRDNANKRGSLQPRSSSLIAVTNGNQCIVCKQNHPLYSCKNFLSQAPSNRLQLLKKHRLCINCMREGHPAPRCKLRSCTKCPEKHNTLVHPDGGPKGPGRLHYPSREPNSTSAYTNEARHPKTHKEPEALSSGNEQPVNQSTILTAQVNKAQKGYILLSTVLVKLRNNEGSEVECRAVLDSGSQVNLITEKLVKKLSLKEIRDPIHIQGIGQGVNRTQHRVNVVLQSKTSGFATRLEAFVLSKITTYQPAQQLDISSWSIPRNVQLADPEFHRPSHIDLLIGAELYFELLSIGQIKLGTNLPTLQNTVFGWVISGKVQNATEASHMENSAMCGICTEEGNLDEQLEKFWKLEEVDNANQKMTASEIKCESHFNQNTQKDSEGRFTVRLPFSQNPNELGESRNIALTRFYSLERKFNKHPDMKKQYTNFIQEYISLGHMEEVNLQQVPAPHYYLPHHCVMKPDSTTTRLRVVFDASMKTSSNVSLNDILYTGPTLQDELFSILLRFRFPRYVFTADIEKMYRQVKVHQDDRRFQMILWRDDPSHPLKNYQLCTVTYGVTTAPYLAIRCLQRLATETAEKYPLGSLTLQRAFYVDDVMTGANSLREAMETQEQLNKILSSSGFKLRKWCANNTALLQHVPTEDRAPQLEIHEGNDCHVKTLGLTWLPRTDEFAIKTQWTDEDKVTKRRVLSETAHLFDPLGIMSPVVITAKIFIQKLWLLKLDWDAAVPVELHTSWIKFRQALKALNNIRIPRHVLSGRISDQMQLHAFSDASEKAYGAAIYVRSILQDGTIIVRLLCAKSRVAPTKTITVPRLELCAAKLATDLTQRVKKDLQWNNPCYFWTDSEIVLAWINSQSVSYHTFVANRVAAIQMISTADQWNHVPSKHNPADLISRGITPEKLINCNLWFYGPLFLHGHERSWPSQPLTLETDLEKKQAKVVLATTTITRSIIEEINHCNSFDHLQRTVAYILRFTRNARRRSSLRTNGPLNVQELEDALWIIIRETQMQGFKDDLEKLKLTKYVNASSSLSSLSPFLDDNGIIRVGGRLQEAEVSYDAKHPILLPYAHNITRLLMTQTHNSHSHVGAQALLAITRQRFWPIKGKTIARSIVQNCVRCTRCKPKLLGQLMGNLPGHRVQPSRPFINVGVDFCGPFWVHFKMRGKRPQKCYVAIFCCFATKAVHIEVVSDLTTEAFIGALRRFVSRRGSCTNIYCDNATNFVGASNQLKELQEIIHNKGSEEKITHFCTKRGIEFHFIPPRAPHFGGLWEAAVKSAKGLFQKSVAAASLTQEELQTVMAEIEAILNSRPITPMSSDPNDLHALTPGHFLIGEPLTSIVDPHAEPSKGGLLQRWKLVAHLKREFWQRWTKEYLSELQHRYKWKQRCSNAQPGTMVIIKDDNLPTLSWPVGRIAKIIKGDDGLVRVADVKTASGVLRRPIHRLAPLPIEPTNEPSFQHYNECYSQNQSADNHETSQGQSSSSKESSKHNSSTEEDEAPTRKRSRCSSATSLFLLTCLIMPILGEPQVNVTPFKTQPGIYFEGLGSVHLISNEWNLVIHYDLSSYWKELETIKNGTSTLNHICKSIKENRTCTQTVAQFNNIINEIENNNELLIQHTPSRKRRAPLDIIGNLANSLFGVLDSNYAQEMAKIINNVEGNQQHLLELLKNQTSIIDSTSNILKRSNEMTENHLREFEGYLNQTISRINEQKVAEIFNALSVRLILLTTNYQRTQSMLLDVIIDTHHGKINPLLLSPKQLQAQLILIKENLPPTLRLPAERSKLLELYSLMSVEGRVASSQIIFRLKLPLFSYETFELLRIVPVPVLVNDTFVTIEVSTRFLIVNLHRDQYYPLPENEMSMCSTIGQSTHMCKQHHPIYRKASNISACELGFLINSPSPSSCKFSRDHTTPRWIQLFDPNHWIYVMSEETTINIVCGNSISQRTLSGSGIVNISSGCAIKDDETTIQAHNLYPTSMRTSFVPTRNLTELLQPFEMSELLVPSISHRNISREIATLQDEIAQLHSKEEMPLNYSQYTIHHFSIGYASLIIAIGVIGYLLWQYVTNRRQQGRTHPPVPAPRRREANFRLSPAVEEIIEQDVQRAGGC